MTVEAETKLLPEIVSVKSGESNPTLDGDRPVTEGAGITGAGETTLNGRLFDVNPPGFVTVTLNAPGWLGTVKVPVVS